MKRKWHILRALDLRFLAGAFGVMALLGGAVEVGRAASVAAGLKSTVVHAGQLALQSYAGRRDPEVAHDLVQAMFAESTALAEAELTGFEIDEPTGTLRVVGSAPIELRMLAPFGWGRILVDHTFVAPLPPGRVAETRQIATPVEASPN
jgi:hypothetical protein